MSCKSEAKGNSPCQQKKLEKHCVKVEERDKEAKDLSLFIRVSPVPVM